MHSQTQPARELRRSAAGTIAGVCAGLSEYFGVSLIVVRALMIILALFNGLGLIVYFILFLALPSPRSTVTATQNAGEGSANSSQPANRWQRLAAWITGITGVIVAFTDLTEKVLHAVSVVAAAIGLIPTPQPVNPPYAPAPTSSIVMPVSQELRNGTYWIGQRSDTVPDLVLTEIQLTDSRTVIKLRYANTETEPANISVAPPGDRHAFLIAAPDGTRIVPLRRVSGIATATQIIVRQGEAVEFVLEFDRIDSDLAKFHLIEGVEDDPELIEWMFSDITLRQPA